MDLVMFVLGLTFETSLKKKKTISIPKDVFKEYVKYSFIICQENFGGLKAYATS